MNTQFEDPDGNAFTLPCFGESTRQIEARRREIAERQEFERLVAQEVEIAKQVQARLFPQNVRRLERSNMRAFADRRGPWEAITTIS